MDKKTSEMEMRSQMKDAGFDPDMLDDPCLNDEDQDPMTENVYLGIRKMDDEAKLAEELGEESSHRYEDIEFDLRDSLGE